MALKNKPYLPALLLLLLALFLLLMVNIAQASSTTPFITTWEVNEGDLTVTIPIGSYNYNYHVDWGDGSVNTDIQGIVTHTFATPGIKTIKISGEFPAIYFNNGGDKAKLRTIEAWGDQNWQSMRAAFRGVTDLTINASDTPNLSNVTDMSSMFREVVSLSGNFASWDTSNVTRMEQLFRRSKNFNEDISSWSVGRVTNMTAMFRDTPLFNQPFTGWKTSSLIKAEHIFRGAKAFNQSIGHWDISKLFRLRHGFSYASSLSASNYDKTLRGWASQKTIYRNFELGAVGVNFCHADIYRNTLINDHGWRIIDAGEETDSRCTSDQSRFSHPNVVIIMADDLGYGDVSSYNENSVVNTTNIDALAANGIKFTNAHSPHALCTPSRYGLLTGTSGYRNNINKVLKGITGPVIKDEQTTLAELMQQGGYQTAMIGKWHLGGSLSDASDPLLTTGVEGDLITSTTPTFSGALQQGFDYSFGRYQSINGGSQKDFENDTWLDASSIWFGGAGSGINAYAAGWSDITDDLSQVTQRQLHKAINYIDQHANDTAPFFLYLPLSAPHQPVNPSPDFKGSTPYNYTDFIAEVDDYVGQVVKKLKENNILEDTLIIFTSDNGAEQTVAIIGTHRGTGVIDGINLAGEKSNVTEGGHRVPFIVQWGANSDITINRGLQSNELINLYDIYASLAELTGLDIPENNAVDSWNMVSALLGDGSNLKIREANFATTAHIDVALTAAIDTEGNEWKLNFGRKMNPLNPLDYSLAKLYNLTEDIGETNNLLADGGTEEMQAKALELQAIMQRYLNDGRSAPQ